jgi:hypothetical protein
MLYSGIREEIQRKTHYSHQDTHNLKNEGDKCGKGYPTDFLFPFQQYLYIVWMVGAVAQLQLVTG